MKPPESIARREMLRRSLRYAGLGTLAGLGGWLGRRALREGCVSDSPCRACPRFDGCALPRARSAKLAEELPSYPPHPGNG